MPQTAPFRFQPHSHSWIALHPKPKGIVQFIGGAFFGTYPTLFYRPLLHKFYAAGYTVIALPFRFTFNHWQIALDLLQEHYCLRYSLIAAAQKKGYETDIYLDAANYAWLGHSLGCKYIALLELLSSPQDIFEAYSDGIGISAKHWTMIQRSLKNFTRTLRQLETNIQTLISQPVNYGQPSIYNEASLLLAPTITDLNGAVPIKSLEKPLSKVLKVSPTTEQTHTLIQRSKLFNVTHMIQFSQDDIARATCDRLKQEQPHITHTVLPGTHLAPLKQRNASQTELYKKAVSALDSLQKQLRFQNVSRRMSVNTPSIDIQTKVLEQSHYAALTNTVSPSIFAS